MKGGQKEGRMEDEIIDGSKKRRVKQIQQTRIGRLHYFGVMLPMTLRGQQANWEEGKREASNSLSNCLSVCLLAAGGTQPASSAI